MLASFMRPVMLVLGFVVACMLVEVICGFLMKIYPTVVANAQMDSMTGLLSILGYSALFVVLTFMLINSAMSVTYLLPDAIFQFIGAHASATAQIGRDTAGAAERSAVAAAATVGQGLQMTGQHTVSDRTGKASDTTKSGVGEGGVKSKVKNVF